jgi:Glycosyltransferase family 87
VTAIGKTWGIEAARPAAMNPTRDLRTTFVIALALVATAIKLAIAYNTIGTNDAVFFYGFSKILNEHGLEWTYAHSRYFNHPPLTAYYLRGIFVLTEQHWCQDLGIHFPFLLRLPGIVADFLVVLVLLWMRKVDIRIPFWTLALFALSPVSLMVSGFHGNTDPVMVIFLISAIWMCLRDQPALAGLFFALSCQIKVVPLLSLPAFVLFWWSQNRSRAFLVTGMLTTSVLWAEPLLKCPLLFAKNVLGYGSYWGIWGVTYLFRETGLPRFSRLSFFDLEPAQIVIVTLLKVVIVTAALWIAWQRRHARGRAFFESLGYTWLVFFVFAPGVCPQYLIWLAPFILVLSPTFYAFLTIASSVFLFEFYNITSGGLPWSVALVDDSKQHWTSWSLLPWLVIVAGSLATWRKTADGRLDPRLFEFVKVRVENA